MEGLKQLFCWHRWVESPFRALNAIDEVWYKCEKCGKHKS